MSITVVVALQVADIDNWKAKFDSAVGRREAAGIHATAYKELEGASDRVHVIGTAPSKDDFMKFFSTPEQQEGMKKAGVMGPPEIKFLEEA